jgi:hypothetical protein
MGALNAVIGLFLTEGQALDGDAAYRTVHQFMHGIFS